MTKFKIGDRVELIERSLQGATNVPKGAKGVVYQAKIEREGRSPWEDYDTIGVEFDDGLRLHMFPRRFRLIESPEELINEDWS